MILTTAQQIEALSILLAFDYHAGRFSMDAVPNGQRLRDRLTALLAEVAVLQKIAATLNSVEPVQR